MHKTKVSVVSTFMVVAASLALSACGQVGPKLPTSNGQSSLNSSTLTNNTSTANAGGLTTPASNSGIIQSGAGAAGPSGVDSTPIIGATGVFGAFFELAFDESVDAQAICMSYANIIGTLGGRSNSDISAGATCVRVNDVFQVQLSATLHQDQFTQGTKIASYQSNPMPFSSGTSLHPDPNNRKAVDPGDCLTRQTMVNSLLGGFSPFKLVGSCVPDSSGTKAIFVITLSQ